MVQELARFGDRTHYQLEVSDIEHARRGNSVIVNDEVEVGLTSALWNVLGGDVPLYICQRERKKRHGIDGWDIVGVITDADRAKAWRDEADDRRIVSATLDRLE